MVRVPGGFSEVRPRLNLTTNTRRSSPAAINRNLARIVVGFNPPRKARCGFETHPSTKAVADFYNRIANVQINNDLASSLQAREMILGPHVAQVQPDCLLKLGFCLLALSLPEQPQSRLEVSSGRSRLTTFAFPKLGEKV